MSKNTLRLEPSLVMLERKILDGGGFRVCCGEFLRGANRWLKTLGLVAAAMSFAGGAYGSLSFEKTKDQLILWDSGRVALVYNHGVVEPNGDGVARTAYIHPLYGLDGDILTDDFPSDHLHHRGVFFAWPRIMVFGEQVDLWHLRGLRPASEDLQSIHVNETRAFFEASNFWVLEDGRQVVRERLRYAIHSSNETGRAIDVHATFTNLTDEPIVLGGAPQAAYGGLNVRIDGQRPEVEIVTARGLLESDQNRMEPPSPWAAHSSLAANEAPRSGVAIFQHPENPDFPAPNWTLRHYGFLGAAWPGEKNYSIAPGAELDLRYRLWVYRGTAEEGEVAKQYDLWKTEKGKNATVNK